MQEERKNPANRMARDSITEALIQLSKTKPLSAITISELAERAGVSRMTFYRNYKSKEEVLSFYLEKLLREYEEKERAMCLSGPYYSRERMAHCFAYWYEYREFFDVLILRGFGNMFMEYLTAYIIRKWSDPSSEDKVRYRLAAFTGMLCNLYMYWSCNGYRKSAEEIAEIVEEVYSKGPSRAEILPFGNGTGDIP